MSGAVSRAVQVRRRSRARQVRNIMATAAPAPPRVESVPVSREEEIDDDFVLIELVLDGKNRGKSKPPSGEQASKNQKTVPATTSVVPTNLEEYEDFVELTIEDANVSAHWVWCS